MVNRPADGLDVDISVQDWRVPISPRRSRPIFLAFLALLLPLGLLPLSGAMGQTPDGAQTAPSVIPQEKLDSLLAPVALYPDQLLVQTLMAATYPLDVVSAARFVTASKDLQGEALTTAVAGQNWDPSVQSLTAYPQVLLMMNDKLDWTQELGDAFLTDEKRVMDTVQVLRKKAYEAGNLTTSEQQQVIVEKEVIIIQPAKTEVVYVPTYNPTVVYGTWWAPTYPPYYYPPPPAYYPPPPPVYSGGAVVAAGLIGFGLGVAIADDHWGWCGADWDGGDINIDVDRNNVFINNKPEFKTKVNNGNWQHNPAQRKGVAYSSPTTRAQYSRTDPNAVSARREVRGVDSTAARTGTSQPRTGVGSDTRQASAGQTAAGAGQRGASVGTQDMQAQKPQAQTQKPQSRSAGTTPGTASRSSLNTSQSRQQVQGFSSRGAASRGGARR